MYCEHCGKPVGEKDEFCEHCGKPLDDSAAAETKQLSISVLDQSMDTAMKTQEWLFRTYIGAQDNKERIEQLQEMLKKRGK